MSPIKSWKKVVRVEVGGIPHVPTGRETKGDRVGEYNKVFTASTRSIQGERIVIAKHPFRIRDGEGTKGEWCITTRARKGGGGLGFHG